ncbi:MULTISPECIES: hypothetical protein [unclassified Streptomyces]|uniref:hypothetical protein n=1 Tax=unclassified Streptomyces TaxID=2593676 RepID=UPI0016610E5C|nr:MULTISPECIES: hypothetical protein [unclassified Streptomyces]MBD0711157.1 hypothetical protein [Streptomyces sp. CBMA291]MBD0714188.1 hypothetical protein [Streptomyces sp. CBMA370]
MTRKAGQTTLALMLTAAVLTGCAHAAGGTDGGGTPQAGRAIPFELLTHCGIDEARIGSTYFEAETPLSDGRGNPPRGWGNPTQLGMMTLTSETEAVFTDDAGHVVGFHSRPGALAPKHMCA